MGPPIKIDLSYQCDPLQEHRIDSACDTENSSKDSSEDGLRDHVRSRHPC